MVCVGWKGGGVMGCVVLVVHLSLFLFSSSLPFAVGVRGSARAALRARTLSPNTIVFSLVACLLFSSSLRAPLFLVFGMAVCDSPCITVLCWHDSDRESVSLVFVFLVVACSSLSSSSVATSAVAFGAEDSAVVHMVGSA